MDITKQVESLVLDLVKVKKVTDDTITVVTQNGEIHEIIRAKGIAHLFVRDEPYFLGRVRYKKSKLARYFDTVKGYNAIIGDRF